MKTCIGIGALLLSACSSGRNATPAVDSPAHATEPSSDFDWPVPVGWAQETIPFPLDFAPELPYRGLEELRFAPGFFTTSADTYWSYAFVWWIEDPPSFEPSSISAALREYFRGLALAVGKDKFSMDPERFQVELAPKSEGGREVLVGQVHSYDPFVTGEPIVLNVEVSRRSCPRAAHTAILFLLSPKSMDDAVWTELRACGSALHCE
ncbi:MAG: hypothetical protein ACKVWV_11675 [Planctomycetota bacterium]